MKVLTNLTLRLIALAVVASLLLTGCDAIRPASAQTATPAPATTAKESAGPIVEGRLTPRDSAHLFFAASGPVAEILVEEGDQVAKGAVLARLGEREAFEAAVAAAQLEQAAAQQALNDLNETADLAYSQALMNLAAARQADTLARQKLADLDTEDFQDDIDDARKEVADAKDDLDDAQEEFDKYKDLDKDNTNRKRAEDKLQDAQDDYDQAVRDLEVLLNTLEQAQAAVQASQAQLEDAQRQVEKRQNGPDPDDLALAEKRLQNAQTQLAAAQAALDKLELTAPFSGTIVKVDISQGERAVPNQPVILLADFSAWYVDTSDLTEKEVVQIALGQSAVIVPDALPSLELTAQVESISDAFIEKAGDVTYTVRLLLQDPDSRLRWGMTVEVRFAEAGK